MTFGTNIDYAVTGWQLNAANDTVKLGAGATGNIGNITFGASATGSLFDTGVANNLVFGNATLVQNATLTLNGTVTGTSLNLSNAAVVNIPAGANVDIGSLVIDGSNGAQQVVINVANGATLNVGSLSTTNVASSNMPKILITGTGHVVIAGQKARASDTLAHQVQFSGNNGIYQYEGNIQDVSGKLTITNFALTDQAIFEVGTAYTDQSRYVTSVVGGVLYVNYVDAATGALTEVAHFNYTPSVAGQAAPNVLIVKNDASSTGYDIIITKCFLTGTHILTPEGEVTVENLKAGDSVITLQNGQQVSKQIVWAGNMDVSVNNYEHKDALYPVRIKAHAFGLNQPCRDLLVTPEHTIYVDGGLVPARMLVNGRSIITDTSMDSFTVYHIETEEHSILLSENLTTESYLNTDDRHQFNGSAINLHLTFNENAGHQSWESDAAAPLTVARHQVEPIWQMLDRRATQQGYAPVSKPEVTNDPSLCLITQKGERLQPVDVKGNTYSFYVPANVRVVAMHSKAALPSEVVGPYLDDRRMLGVLVAKINVFGDRNLTILPADMTGLSGWHPAELNRADRWTKGLATLPEAVAEVSTKVKLIKVELTATSEYFVDMIEVAEKIA
ncbi:Large exoprotein involved in heme utilization or adhesion (FhaB) (PDB:4RM6) [Commensalibacter papalotli (ex Botero et al. 2024)]|uniref:Large exoprotein involved in heme utilization or adhesion (FhaB) (PDB:4RM6) n=1 Tax=Commensalibacter papalotli (ex Botero et al. 2024) TaxID=2972766 RepID=A0ABM9HU75_9PROT|nr:Large exoprotein involved in heme utilization or adhesion (FhaB) (PDB:4RM6) [Commensalibacter papalotli (ex Botero et al. 2024)]CAI3958524.1 Large exoprotein involved in heme utilization or adhesion (FhaB) (PDB:4RM6) [Commensalibacter papalotli (ex Botero et al. 2024)]